MTLNAKLLFPTALPVWRDECKICFRELFTRRQGVAHLTRETDLRGGQIPLFFYGGHDGNIETLHLKGDRFYYDRAFDSVLLGFDWKPWAVSAPGLADWRFAFTVRH